MQALSFRSVIFTITCILLTAQGFAQNSWHPGEVLVLLEKDARIEEVQRALLTALPARSIITGSKSSGKSARYHKITLQNTNIADRDLEKVVARMPGVQATALNHKLKFLAQPNDLFYTTQWNMDDINVEPVWEFTTGGTMANGERIGVGICDEAIQTNHPDLEDNIWPNSPFQSGAAPHGTEVASVVGAVGNNATGIAGVNWDVEILSSTDADDLFDVIEQFELAIALREQFNNTNGNSGLMVVSITASWGIEDPGGCDGFTVPLFTDMTNAGIILVTSGPNDPVSIESGNDFPSNCALAEHLVVTSYGPDNETPFAFGPSTVHLLAPGLEIPVATTTSTYTVVDGNSFAIPTVAGAIALLYSIPCLGFADLVMDDPVAARTMVKNAILNNTAPFPGGSALTITGGKLDVFAAYQSLMAQCPACDTVTVQLNTSAGNAAQYNLVNGIGATIAQGTGDEFQICPGEGCFNGSVVDGTSQPLNGTFSVAYDGEVFQTGTIVNGELTFDFGQVTNGCTDPSAANYDPSATCDDGSCCFSNPLTIYLLATDQVANGTAQLSVEAGGNTLFNGPVNIASVPDADLSYGSVTICAPGGCLQLNAQQVDVALQPSGVAQSAGGPFSETLFPIGQPTTIAVGFTPVEQCDGIDNNCDGVIDEDFIWFVDADLDGWGVAGSEQIYCIAPGMGYSQLPGDCDDTNADVNPFMPDGCASADGIDNNCDGNIDEGDLLAWYPDMDADGFGDEDGGVLACTAPPDHVLLGGDCDDTNNTISPVAIELCDGIDNNCDGVIDEGFTWYTDADGDGYGDDATALNTCSPPQGAVQIGGDCNDNDPALIGNVSLYILSDLDAIGGTAHYVFTQGSSVIEGDITLTEDEDFPEVSVGLASACLGSGCLSIEVSQNDVPLLDQAYVLLPSNPNPFEEFSINTGFFGSNGTPANELCDGLDNDCDGEIDEDFRWYTDADGDGFGDDATMQVSCTPVAGAVQVGGDCNDADTNLTIIGAPCNDGNAATNNDIMRSNCTCLGFLPGECPPGEVADCNGNCAPEEWIGDGFCDDGSFEHNGNPIFFNCAAFNADEGDCEITCTTEICDGLDNDCDGEVDEDFTWYTDADGDGFGDPATAVVHCAPPQGLVQTGGDCDDTDPTINPGATDACDGIDRNCDGDLPGTNGNEVYSPDWTAMATTGETVHLYDLLGQGKTVVLDLFAAWCAPSQQMLASNFLQDWNAHMGPDGTDQIRIVAIAVDQNAGSLAPFINAAQWPVIVDDAESFGLLYQEIGMFNNAIPTLLMICPDRSVTMLYPQPDLLPSNGIFQYNSQAAVALLNDLCACRDACITNVGCMDVNGCDYDPLATCPGPCATAQEWFVDNDGDGSGTTSLGVSCTRPANSANTSGDCDDTNAQVQRALTLVVLTDDPGDVGTAHYLIQQGSTIIEGDLDLPAVTEGVGYLPLCIGDACFTITITQNDVPLYPESYLQFASDPENTLPFNTSEGYTGGASAEICDGIDNDCNGLVDDGFTPQYADDDGDGFGDLLQPLPCDTPGVANNQDCDDNDPNVFPGSTVGFNCIGCSAADQLAMSQNLQVSNGSLTGPFLNAIITCAIGCNSAGDPAAVEACSQACFQTAIPVGPSCGECLGIYIQTVFASGCNGPCGTAALAEFQNCTGLADADGDGYFAPADCDDQDPAVNPGTPDICDGIDNNCDGFIDDINAYADTDGDGYGDPAAPVACGTPGSVSSSSDCDDTNANVNPAATEVCDQLDNDCDGAVDEGLERYADSDGDGYGDPLQPVACNAAGVANDLDCDDTDPLVHPEQGCAGCASASQTALSQGLHAVNGTLVGPTLLAAVQCFNTCNDPLDPVASEACFDACLVAELGIGASCSQCLVEYLAVVYGGECNATCSANALAQFITCAGLVDNDNDGYFAPTDCNDQDASSFPGAQEVCDGADNDCDGIVDEAGGLFADNDGDGFGDPNVVLACGTPGVTNGSDCNDYNAQQYPGGPVPCPDCSPADQALILSQPDYFASASSCLSGCLGQGGNLTNCLSDCLEGSGLGADCADCVAPYLTCIYSTCPPCLIDPSSAACIQCRADSPCNTAYENCTGLIDNDNDGAYVFADCDDNDPTIYPNALEQCDGLDNDCDGLVDEGAEVLNGYVDADGDGWGNEALPVSGCPLPAGAVLSGGDCDDADPTVFPFNLDDCAQPDGIDNDCDGQIDNGNDLDGDGTSACEGDCDDANANVHPGAAELCDGIDNDCNGAVDDGLTPQYADNDGDGFGDLLQPLPCDTPGVANADDCDDTDPDIFPGQGCEGCSATDLAWLVNDGQPDFACGASCSAPTPEEVIACLVACYVADGLGEACATCVVEYQYCTFTQCPECEADPYSAACVQCVQSAGCAAAFTACSGLVDADQDGSFQPFDCDDNDPSIHPGAVESCNGVDDDCDGVVDNGNPETCNGIDDDCDGSIDEDLAFLDADGDGFGDASSPVACGSPGSVLNNDDCDDGDPAVNPAAPEVCNGIDDNCNSEVDESCVVVAARVFLEGPYDPTNGLMNDGMRTLGLVPTTEPYTGMGYYHVQGGGESTSPAVLAITGSNAIVDWVVLELRDRYDPSIIVSTRSALLQRDGDVVDTDGLNPVSLPVVDEEYHVAIRHRNHLGAMTNTSVYLFFEPTPMDLTSAAIDTYGTNARKSVSGVMVLWAGDVTFDGFLQYTGENNDRDRILTRIGGTVPTNTIMDYHGTDVNLDGAVKYTGLDNDRDLILQNIGGTVPTNTRLEQLP